MAGRVLSTMDAAAPTTGGGRFYQGLSTADEAISQGYQLTPGMRALLDAPTAEGADYAKKMLWKEGLKGVGEQEVQAMRLPFTRKVMEHMGVMDDVAPTDSVLNEVLKTRGQTIGRVLEAEGNLAIPPELIGQMRGVVDAAESTWASSLKRVVDDVEASVARNGTLSPQSYQNAITRLGEIGAPGKSAGAILDANKLRDALSGQVEAGLSTAAKDELRTARYQYKIAKTVREGATRGGDSLINPATFNKNWDKRIGQTLRGVDELGKTADTLALLMRKDVTAGSTLQRNIAELPQKIVAGATSPLGGSAIGTALAGGLYGLLGN